MRGFSSGFPRGSAGVGLLILRVAVGLQLLLESGCGGATPWWLALSEIVVGLALQLGFITPVAATLSALYQLTCLTHASWTHAAALMVAVLTALALALLGPGAYALDARLFGRRRLVVPATSMERE